MGCLYRITGYLKNRAILFVIGTQPLAVIYNN